MKIRFILYFTTIILVLSSCTDKRSKLMTEIKKVEEQISANPELFDMYMGQKLIDSYVNYTNSFPNDTINSELLYKAALASLGINNPKQSLTFLDKIISNYKNSHIYPEAILYKGLIFESNLNNIDSARIWYESFIEQYPEHPLTNDIKISLEYLGKPYEEVIDLFTQKQTETE